MRQQTRAWLGVAQNCCILSGGCSPCKAARISEFLGWNWTKNLLWLRYFFFCFSFSLYLFLSFSLANVIDKFVVVELFFFSFAGRLALRSLFCFVAFWILAWGLLASLVACSASAASSSRSSAAAACTTFAVLGRFWLDLYLVLLLVVLFCSWYFCWYFLLLCLLIFYWYLNCKFTGIYAVILLVFYWYLRLVFASYYFNCIKAI